MFKINYYSDHMKNSNDENTHNVRFNTPSYHLNAEVGNTGFGKNKQISFSATARYKPSYEYEVAGGLGKGEVASSLVIDAQVGYKLIKANSTIRIGATNLTNQYYSTGIANPMIGGMYYVSLGYNVF
jgi:outer membrane receptor protein involved in Fe transport